MCIYVCIRLFAALDDVTSVSPLHVLTRNHFMYFFVVLFYTILDVYTYTHTHVHIHTYVYICIHVCIYTHIYIHI